VILVTGSTGYLGSHLVRFLLHKGMSVRGLVRPQELQSAVALAKQGMQIWQGDLLVPETLMQISQNVTLIYHLAGMHSISVPQMHQVYVQGTRNLIQAFEGHSALQCCIVASNNSVYGHGGERWLTEDSPQDSLSHPFGSITAEMEQVLLTVSSTFPTIILRIAEVYGPGMYNPVWAYQKKPPRLLGDGQNWSAHIHIQDLLTVFYLATTRLRPGEIYNVADDLPVRSCDYYGMIAQLVSASPPKWIPLETAAERLWLSVHGLRAFSLRISNAKIKEALALALQYPSYREGLPSLLDSEPS
jgi:nucleoside-diphosphate-sugar epimerase